MKELKPCPFCGCEVKKIIASLTGTVMFICDNCGADVCFFGAEKDKKATNAWNRRFGDVESNGVKYGKTNRDFM